VAYHTYGHLNPNGDNVIWVFHALTANSNVPDWWPGLFGEKRNWILRAISLYVQTSWVVVMALLALPQ
jgi:homoserine acetyltransferase